jgi:tRNA(Ile)-lysidine synthase
MVTKDKMSNNFLTQSINSFIKIHDLLPQGSKIIVGLSGGPDSVFLLHFLKQKQEEGIIELIAAHLDHEWRPDSYKDRIFCKELTHKLDIPLVIKKMSELQLPFVFNGSKEEFGRKARRFFFESLIKEFNADFIGLAHHAQDQQETFFIRLIRGSTLTGLTAMWPKHGLYIRPLLHTNKQDILDYLHEHNIQYLTDPTNVAESYLRNRIRLHVLPALHHADSRFDQNFMRTIDRLQETESFLEELTHKSFDEISELKDGISCINLKKLFELDQVLQYRILMQWLITSKVQFPITQDFLDEIIRFLKSKEGGDHQIHAHWKIVKRKNVAQIEHSKY